MNTPMHNHRFTLIYRHNCRACEIARFERELPLGGNEGELLTFVSENTTLTYWDKEYFIDKFNLREPQIARADVA
jgi:hypothetical protein